MGDVVSLNEYRKRRAKRQAAEKRAQENLGPRRRTTSQPVKAELEGNRLKRKPYDEEARRRGVKGGRNETEPDGPADAS